MNDNLEREQASGVFAWDGVSFRMPSDWNLADYRYRGGAISVTLEDDVAVRLELEWVRPSRVPDMRQVRKRFERASEALRGQAAGSAPMPMLPGDWTGCLYTMRDRRLLAVAMHAAGQGRFVCFLRIHGEPGERRALEKAVGLVVSTFRLHAGGTIPWRVYDIAFSVPSVFRLEHTVFEAGRKQMVFGCRLRRLHLWFVSLANLALDGRTPGHWAAEFLNRSGAFKGPVFETLPDDTVVARRSRLYPFGHFEEIGRLAFRYQVTCRHDRERNRLALSVFHYRRAADQDWITQLPDAKLPLAFGDDTNRFLKNK